jgi:hypothetical protein
MCHNYKEPILVIGREGSSIAENNIARRQEERLRLVRGSYALASYSASLDRLPYHEGTPVQEVIPRIMIK